jgi:hypothetical protein
MADLDETLREPLQVTCYFEVATLEDEPTFSVAVPIFEAKYDESGDHTGQMKKRPERVRVTPVVRREPYRPERARPSAPPKKKITPRANTVPSATKEKLDVFSLAMFWGVALSGSLVAIGIALASW